MPLAMLSQRAVPAGDDARTAGLLAITVSALWTVPAAVAIVYGMTVALHASTGLEGGIGLMIAGFGLGILLTVAVGVTLSTRLLRGLGTTASAVFFGLGAALSGFVSYTNVAGSPGLVKLWAVPLVVNAVACSAVVVLARRSATG